MFAFTRTTNIFGAQNFYLATGPLNDDPIYLAVFCLDGTIKSYVA